MGTLSDSGITVLHIGIIRGVFQKSQATPGPFMCNYLGWDWALGVLKAPLSFHRAAKAEDLCFKQTNNQTDERWNISSSPKRLFSLQARGRKDNILALLHECIRAFQSIT